MDKVRKTIEDIRSELKEKGYKITVQREAVLETFLNSIDAHLSPEEVYDKVRDNYPEIGLATIYRTLQLFEEIGILYRHNFDDGCSRYELNTTGEDDHQHHHLICLKCGSVQEVNIDLLDSLEREIEETKKFKIVDHNLKFFGYCKDCKDKSQ